MKQVPAAPPRVEVSGVKVLIMVIGCMLALVGAFMVFVFPAKGITALATGGFLFLWSLR